MAASSNKDKVVKILKVTADGARIRRGPSSAYSVVTSIRKGQCVFYLEKNKEAFCYVRSETGEMGYMYKGFLKSYGAAKLDQVYMSKVGNLSVYKRPSTTSSRVFKLAKKQHVMVYKTQDGWAYIKTMDGDGGFVRLNKLKKCI